MTSSWCWCVQFCLNTSAQLCNWARFHYIIHILWPTRPRPMGGHYIHTCCPYILTSVCTSVRKANQGYKAKAKTRDNYMELHGAWWVTLKNTCARIFFNFIGGRCHKNRPRGGSPLPPCAHVCFEVIWLVHIFSFSLLKSLQKVTLPRQMLPSLAIAAACRASLLRKGAGSLMKGKCFKSFIENFSFILQEQHKFESQAIADRTQLKHSKLMQNLTLIARELNIENALRNFCIKMRDRSTTWTWLEDYFDTIKMLNALLKRNNASNIEMKAIAEKRGCFEGEHFCFHR